MKKQENFKVPCEIILHPNWWHTHYGICFNEDYFFSPEKRVKIEQKHKQILYDRFGSINLGENNPAPKPIIGPIHLAAGFMISGILGCKINFKDNSSPEVIPRNLTDKEALALEVPDIKNSYLMNMLLNMMSILEKEYGYIEGDLNWEGLQNVALDLRGEEFLMDYYLNPDLVNHLLEVIYKTTIEFVNIIKDRTKTSSISVNKIIEKVDLSINLHSNCSVTMISKETYNKFLLPYEKRLSKQLQPYGIHHCGKDLHKVAESYAEVNPAFVDTGWGSDIVFCREKLPNTVLSVRIDPVQMKKWTPDEVKKVVEQLVKEAGINKTVVCCINMDSEVPDDNILALFGAAHSFH